MNEQDRIEATGAIKRKAELKEFVAAYGDLCDKYRAEVTEGVTGITYINDHYGEYYTTERMSDFY